MRTSLLIVLGFAVLAVTLAGNSKKNAVKERDVDKSTPVGTEKNGIAKNEESEPTENKGKGKGKQVNPKNSKKDDDEAEAVAETSPSKSKKNTKSASKEKSSKKPLKEEKAVEIDEDLGDLLQDEEEEEDEEIEIPSLDKLTTDIDPIKLGQKIKNISDEITRKQLITKLKQMWKANKKSLPGKFYQAAYASLINEEEALKFWDKNLEKAIKKVYEVDKTLFGDARKSLGNSFENVENIVAADPLSMGVEKSESILLTVLSDTLKNLGKVSDSAYDAAMNASGIVDALTSPVDMVPIVNTMKRNFHNNLENSLRRGKYLSGSFADNGSKAFENAAKDADQKAEAKQDLLNRLNRQIKKKDQPFMSSLAVENLVESFITLPIEMNLKTQKFFKYVIPSYSDDSPIKTVLQHLADAIKEQEIEWEEMYDKSYESRPYYE